MDIITTNPFRILGVYSNAKPVEIVSNCDDMEAYLNIGQKVSFDLDLNNLMPNVVRSADSVSNAKKLINLPIDKLKYALFWFVKDSSSTHALSYLKNGDFNNIYDVLDIDDSFSSMVNKSVTGILHDNDLGFAIGNITKLIHNNDLRKNFVKTICGEAFSITEEDLAHLYIDSLLEEVSASELFELFEENGVSEEDDEYLRAKVIDEPISRIKAEIAQAKTVDRNDADANYQAGMALMQNTKADLEKAKSLLGASDMRYQMLADDLANTILQCGINYFNNTSEDEDVQIGKAFTLQNYALSIVVGRLTKDRCKENVDILKKKKEELPPKEAKYYDKKIKDALAVYMTQPDKISYAISLIKKVVPYLMSIKEVFGCNNTYYLRMSTLIVNASLHNIIEEFNSVMNDGIRLQLLLDREATMRTIRNVFDQAWKATLYMDKLDMEPEFKRGRYNQNRSTLKDQVEQVINVNQTVSLDMRGEKKIFEDCRTISDLNNYTSLFPDGKYASQVKDRIEKIEYDACKTTQDCQKFKDKYPRTKYDIDSKWEECYYKQCRYISHYEGYLRDYPNGRYVSQARAIIDKLSYDACRLIPDYQTYLRKFPSGAYVNSAKNRIDELSYESCQTISDYRSYMSRFPHGKYYSQAKSFVDDEEMWGRCASSDSKDLYKEYLSKFPNGRHKTEAEQKSKACYIATMCYGDYSHPQVLVLRDFRDSVLLQHSWGQAFVQFYYRNSPNWVEHLKNKRLINKIIRNLLDKFIILYKHVKK